MPPLRFGMIVFPQAGSIDLLIQRWKRTEALGFDSIWVADEVPMQFPGTIAHEAWALMGVLARETSRVRIGTAVTAITFRHPVLLAMSASTVDHASGGRLVLGVGAGGGPKGYDAMGFAWSASERGERLERQLATLDALLRGETVSVDDGPYRTREAWVERPVQRPRPPLMVAAQTPRTLRATARYADVWNTLGGQPAYGGDAVALRDAVERTRQQIALLDDACAAVGRDPASLARSLFIYRMDQYASVDAIPEIVRAYQPLGIGEFILGWPRATRTQSADEREGVLERLASDVLASLRA